MPFTLAQALDLIALRKNTAANFRTAEQHLNTLQANIDTLSVGAIPSGPAGGDLSGTYPNPSVVNDSHTHDTQYQPVDADLTAVAALAPSNDDVIQRKAGAWTNRTMAQLATDLDGAGVVLDAALSAYLTTASAASTYQPLDSDLTTIAGLTATTDNFMQAKGSAWSSRTVAQVVTDLVTGGLLSSATAASTYQPVDADLTTIAALDSGTAAGVMATEAAGWVKRTYAQVKTSLGLVKADVGLGNVDNTADVDKPVSTAQATANTADKARANHTGTQAATTVTVDSTTLVGTGTDVQAVFEELDNAIVATETVANAAIPKSIVDAKGDVITASAADTVVRTAIGANGTVFTANSAATGGVEWAAAGAPGAHASAHLPGGADELDIDASTVDVTPSGLIVCTTNVQSALVQLEQATQDLREEYEGHHHDERYGRFKVGKFDVPGSTGDYSVTGVGFRPKMVEFSLGFDPSNDYIAGCEGVADETLSQWYVCWIHRHVVALRASYHNTGYCICAPIEGASGTFYVVGNLTSMNADGFTINFSAANASFAVGWKAYR